MPKVLRDWLEGLSEEDAKRVSFYFDSTPDYISWKEITDIMCRRFPDCDKWTPPSAD